ncbi:MAG TPA: YceI family protein [Gaiellaceae bacterium]|jgi:polyisoprenoid-binding protein YceI|nr:YceI family protein [Gaiellaceae bacterium]
MSTTTQTGTAVPTGTWQADTVHSSVGFEVPYAVATFSGQVTDFEATLTDGKLVGSAGIESIQTKEENLQAHLLSPEFFDAERHPVVGFSGTLKRDGDAVEIDGEITIKGITQPAVLTGTIVGPTVDHFGATRVGLKLQTTVDRTKFDINWNMPLPNGEPALANEVTLKADLTLVAQEA